MTAQQTDAIPDPQSMAALQQMLDGALAREAALAEELAARTAELASAAANSASGLRSSRRRSTC